VSEDISPAFLLESATGEFAPAELWDRIGERQLADWEDHWTPQLLAASKRLRDAGMDRSQLPQARHWNWRNKAASAAESLANPSFCVMCAGQTQGMMILNTLPRARGLTHRGKHLVYIEYLESEPWNQRSLSIGQPRYHGVGALLMRVAIEFSRQEGFKGRVGLHSLPQSNGWYGSTCGMTDLGPDRAYQSLRYFEMTTEQADAFIAKGYKP